MTGYDWFPPFRSVRTGGDLMSRPELKDGWYLESSNNNGWDWFYAIKDGEMVRGFYRITGVNILPNIAEYRPSIFARKCWYFDPAEFSHVELYMKNLDNYKWRCPLSFIEDMWEKELIVEI